MAKLSPRAAPSRWRSLVETVGRRLRKPSDKSALSERSYETWVELYDKISSNDRGEIVRHIRTFAYQPLISIVMLAHDAPEQASHEAIQSVRAQLYRNWELRVANDASPSRRVAALLKAAVRGGRVKWTSRQDNAAANNSALELASGEFVAFMDHDDVIPPHALYEVVAELNTHPQADIVYSDEDKIDDCGRRYDPYFKTDWNPELFLGHNFINHLAVYRRSLVSAAGGFRVGFEGGQDYDLALRCIRQTSADRIRHIPAILYHERVGPGPTALSHRQLERRIFAARKAKNGYLAATEQGARVVAHPKISSWERVVRPIPNPAPLVSLLVPTRNRADLLGPCLDGLMNKTSYQPFEIIVIDHESDDPETLALLKRVSADPRVRVMPYGGPFNFSAMNNRAVGLARGELVGLVNNDIEVIAPDWLTEMAQLAVRPENGAVGARLLDRDGAIQHAGVGLGIRGGVASHYYYRRNPEEIGYFGRLQLASNVSAVTGACLVVRKAAYLEVGGLDEANLPVAYNDVDFCLKLREKGYRNVWTPFATLYHHESPSRGLDVTGQNRARLLRDIDWMVKTWGRVLTEDPYFNPNLSLDTETFDLAFPPRRVKPWRSGRGR